MPSPAELDPTEPASEPVTIPVLEETVKIDRRLVEHDRATVRISVSEHDQAIETLLMRQDLTIERVTVDRAVPEPPPVRHEGDTIIVPVLEERLVVEKRLFVTEELRIRIDETRQTHTDTVRLRREHAVVERNP